MRSERCETIGTDERFLPFEGAGVISEWRLELPGQYPQFDYSTISDVVLTIRYTARDGGESLRDSATAAIGEQLRPITQGSSPLRFHVLLSCRADFPTEWAASSGLQRAMTIPLKREFLPYWMDAARMNVTGVQYADVRSGLDATVNFGSITVVAGASQLELAPRSSADLKDRLVLLEVGMS